MYFVFFYLFMVGQPIPEYFPFFVGHCCSINKNTNTTKNFLLKKNTNRLKRCYFNAKND